MSRNSPGSLLDRFLGLCLTFLVAAVALHWGVRLLEEIWVSLAVIGSVVLVIAVAVAVWRTRSRGW